MLTAIAAERGYKSRMGRGQLQGEIRQLAALRRRRHADPAIARSAVVGALAADRLRQKQGISMKQRPKRPAKRKKTELFVKVMLETLDAPAWRAMSHGARSLYVALKRRCRNDLKQQRKDLPVATSGRDRTWL